MRKSGKSPVIDTSFGFVATVILQACLFAAAPQSARAATPYEAQIQGFITASLWVLITGEFAGRSPSNEYALATRPVCKPSDYDDLRAVANDPTTFEAFHKRCKPVESVLDPTHTHGTAYLPPGYCETLKATFDRMLFEQVYSMPADAGDLIIFEYKGSRYRATRRAMVRGAKLESSCRDDGSLRVSAPRKRG